MLGWDGTCLNGVVWGGVAVAVAVAVTVAVIVAVGWDHAPYSQSWQRCSGSE